MFKRITNIILFLYILSLYLFSKNATLYKVSNIVALVFFILIIMEILVTKKKITVSYVVIAQLAFIFVCLISYFVALDKETVTGVIQTLFSLLILVWAIINYIDDFDQFNALLRYVIYSGIISAVYILANPSHTQYGRLGSILGDENHIALMMGMSFLFSIYFIAFKKKFIYIPISVVIFYCILLTGSRIALIFVVLSTLMTFMFRYKDSFISMTKYILFVVFVGIVCYILLFQVPSIYSAVGVRFQNLFDFVSGKGTDEGSILARFYYTKLGFQMFFERPILGYGIGNYSSLLQAIAGRENYSHNNYTELLVGTGLIGAITYYMVYILSLVNLFKFIKSKNTFGFLLFSMVFTTMIIGYSWVYYQMKMFYVFNAIIAVFIKLNHEEFKSKET